MEKAKAFFLICAGVLMLALAFHFGTDTAVAEYGDRTGQPIDFQLYGQGDYDDIVVLTDTGEMWFWHSGDTWAYITTFPDDPVPTKRSDWSQLKGNYGR